MNNQQLSFLLEDIELRCNNAIDKLIPLRQSLPDDQKRRLSYITKKLEVIVGACHRAQDKMPVEFKL